MKKMLALALVLLMVVTVTACGSSAPAAKDTYVVGVCQLVPHEALDAATQGFVDQLKKELGEDKVEIKVSNAAGDAAACASIVNAFVSDDVDLIMANATPALQAAAAATADIPILGTSVTEYGVAMGIPNFKGTVGGNVSGTSDLAPLDEQAQMLVDWCPDAKTVGLLYCSGEDNSRYQVDTMQALLEEKGLTCAQYAFADSNDMAVVCQTAADNSDVLYLPTDNAVASATGIIDGICRPAGVPCIVGEVGILRGCGIATLSISYYDLGVKTGKMAAQILRGEADISTMPVAYADNVTPGYNAEICADLGITPVEGYEAIS